ncbi:hypothetical protein [Falsirhodobacter sp. alg1]|nr:hypothetical protein [Falsirhodobacter sp. alg1]
MNLWSSAECASVKRDLLDRILNWRIQSDMKTQQFRQALSGANVAPA